jgi:RNA polymerase sigma-70 factor (ECF subfamily)
VLYREHAAFVAALVACYRVPSAAVADATQEVFITAYRRWDDFDDDRPVRPWLAGIARRVAFRHRRTAARVHRKRAALRETAVVGRQSEAGRLEDLDFLERFLSALPSDERRVLILAELEGYTTAEIAKRLGWTPESSYACLRRARRRLKRAASDEAAANAREYRGVVPPFAVICAKLPESGSTPWWGSLFGPTGTKVAAGALAVAAVVIVGTEVHRDAISDTSAPEASTEQQASSKGVDVGDAPVSSPSAVAVADLEVEPTVVVQEPVGNPVPATRSPKFVAHDVSGDDHPTPEPGGDELAAEVELLGDARRALDRGNPARALALLKQHRFQFPNSVLAAGRTRAMIRAQCDLGQVRQAQGQAALFARTHPNDPLALQSEHICRVDGRTSDPAENGG